MGETCLSLIEIKLEKARGRGSHREQLAVEDLKKAEVNKINEYCKLGLSCFAHFSYLYAQNKDRTNETCFNHFETLPLHQLVEVFCKEPDESEFI